MSKIITISRQYASGGSEIGRRVAKLLGIPYYDRTIIDITAKESGFSPEYIEKIEQSATASLLYNLSVGGIYCQPLSDQLFVAQCNVIRALADNGPCIIVGRCADYVLRKDYDCFNVFIRSDDKFRIDRIVEFDKVSEQEALNIIRQKDKARRKHYKYYTDSDWGNVTNYDLSLNTAVFGFDKAAQIIADAVSCNK